MILRATELAIQGLLQAAIDDNTGSPGSVPVFLSDEAEQKPQMPYIVASRYSWRATMGIVTTIYQ